MKYEDIINSESNKVERAKESPIAYAVDTSATETMLNETRPYTIEELDMRLDQAETDFKAGRYFSNDSVMAELNQFVQSL